MWWGEVIGRGVGLERHSGRCCLCRFDVGLVLCEGLGMVWVPHEILGKIMPCASPYT